MRWIASLALAGALLTALTPASVLACAACACGDNTLTTIGTEKPYAGRLRVFAGYGFRDERAPDGRGPYSSEQRFELGAAYAPSPRVVLSLQVPMISRAQVSPNLARTTATGLGDLELWARVVLWQDRAVARHLVALQAGVALPLGAALLDAQGAPLEGELQPSRGATSPVAGLLYSYFGAPFSLHLSSRIGGPVDARWDPRLGVSWLQTGLAQVQLLDELALQAGVDTRWSAPSWRQGAFETGSGGFVAFGSGGVLLMPVEDLLLHVIVRVPAYRRADPAHQEGPVFVGGITYDLG